MTDLFSTDDLINCSRKHKKLPKDNTAPLSNRIAASSVLRVNYDMLPDLNGRVSNDFNEYTNPFLQSNYRTAALADSELNYIKKDNGDFTELRF